MDLVEDVTVAIASLVAVGLMVGATLALGLLPGPSAAGSAGLDDGTTRDHGPGPDGSASGCVNDDPTGQRGSGPPATAHRAGAVPVAGSNGSRTEEAPDARLFWTCETTYEPTLGVTSDGVLFFAGIDGQSTPRSPLTVTRSEDGGVTWDRVLVRDPGNIDPYLHVDPATDRVFADDIGGCHELSWSDDGGETWTYNPVAACGSVLDHVALFTAPPVTSPTVGYPRIVYMCGGGLGNPANCAKSLDGGVTWVDTGEMPFPHDGGIGHDVGVAPDGTILIGAGAAAEGSDRDQPHVAISSDEGMTWTRVQIAATGMAQGERASLGSEQTHYVDHNVGIATADGKNVYAHWIGRDRLPYLAVSRDGGRSWEDPLMVGPPGVNEANLPALAVGDEGAVALSYIATTGSPGGPPFPADPQEYENTTWDGYLTVAPDADAEDPLFWTTTVNDPADPLVDAGRCGPGRCQEQVDFHDVQIGPDGRPWTSFGSECGEDDLDAAAECYGEGLVGTLVGGPWVGGS